MYHSAAETKGQAKKAMLSQVGSALFALSIASCVFFSSRRAAAASAAAVLAARRSPTVLVPSSAAAASSSKKKKCYPRRVFLLALTGGPCGGKSSTLSYLKRTLEKKGISLFAVPEVPTIMMLGGCRYPGLGNASRLLSFETAMIKLQLQMEDSFIKVAESAAGKNTDDDDDDDDKEDDASAAIPSKPFSFSGGGGGGDDDDDGSEDAKDDVAPPSPPFNPLLSVSSSSFSFSSESTAMSTRGKSVSSPRPVDYSTAGDALPPPLPESGSPPPLLFSFAGGGGDDGGDDGDDDDDASHDGSEDALHSVSPGPPGVVVVVGGGDDAVDLCRRTVRESVLSEIGISRDRYRKLVGRGLSKRGSSSSSSLVSPLPSGLSLVVVDRGAMDIAAYLPRASWLSVLSSNGLTEEDLLRRYDAVLHLTTAAAGASDFYKRGSVTDDSGQGVYREETQEQARELDCKIMEAWKKHPRRGVITNETDGFEGKLQRATDFVEGVLRELEYDVDEE